MLNFIQNIATLLAALISFIIAVEEEGHGEEKKKNVIDSMIKFIENYRDNIPSFLFNLFSNKVFLSTLLELVVMTLKKFNLLR